MDLPQHVDNADRQRAIATLVLAAAPGGVAEMCITAQVMQLGVPLVTVCHVMRVVVLTVGAPTLYRLFLHITD